MRILPADETMIFLDFPIGAESVQVPELPTAGNPVSEKRADFWGESVRRRGISLCVH